jgi:ribulose-phosphate 3-epimerase
LALAKSIRIAPSILSADFVHLGRDIEKVEAVGADIFHVDIMDGHFVPNITIGPLVLQCIRKATKATLDTHLMVEAPERCIDDFARAGADWISIHAEADFHLNRTVHLIQERGLQAGVAINPATPLSTIEEILPELDYVLIMSVNPGFAGQKFIPSALQKIRRLRQTIESQGYRARIEVDGGMGADNLKQVLDAGAEIVVAGSAIFGLNKNASEKFGELKRIAEAQSNLTL